MRYRIVSAGDAWRDHLRTSHVICSALCKDVSRMGRSYFFGNGQCVEIWDPSDPRGDIMPNMVVEIGEEAVMVEDLGGHDGRLMAALADLVGEWKLRYLIDDLRIEPIEP